MTTLHAEPIDGIEDDSEITYRVEITGAQRDVILAALRLWQQTDNPGTELWEIATNGDSHGGLDNADIDDLCEKLNLEGECVG